MRRSALASTCTSLLAALAFAGEPAPDPARVASLELEATLARSRGVYLVLDTPRRVLEIRSRGIVLDSVPVEGVEVVVQKPLLGGHESETVAVPAVWTITEGDGDNDREVIAPDELRPYTEEEEEEEPAPAATATPGPRPTATPFPEPPASFRARCENGWDVWVTDQPPPGGAFSRLIAAISDGWARLRGKGEERPRSLALKVATADARRLHHLFRGGTRILITASGS